LKQVTPETRSKFPPEVFEFIVDGMHLMAEDLRASWLKEEIPVASFVLFLDPDEPSMNICSRTLALFMTCDGTISEFFLAQEVFQRFSLCFDVDECDFDAQCPQLMFCHALFMGSPLEAVQQFLTPELMNWLCHFLEHRGALLYYCLDVLRLMTETISQSSDLRMRFVHLTCVSDVLIPALTGFVLKEDQDEFPLAGWDRLVNVPGHAFGILELLDIAAQ
jgi:hypothetical protein